MNFVDIIFTRVSILHVIFESEILPTGAFIFGKLLKLKTSQMSFSEPDVANLEL